MKKLCIKANKQQIKFYAKTLEKLGCQWHMKPNYNCSQLYFYFDSPNKDFFVRGYSPTNYELVDTWKDFVFQYLKDFYCVMPSSDDKKRVQRLANKTGLYSCSLFFGDMDYPLFSVLGDCFGFGNINDVKTNKEISLTNLIVLLESVSKFEELNNKENKTMNKKYCHKVKNKFELVAAIAYLKEYFKENDVKFTTHDIEGFMTLDEEGIMFPYLVKGMDFSLVGQDVQYDHEHVSLEEFAEYLLEECSSNNVFKFKNGLVAEYDKENNSVKIGCKDRTINHWLRLAYYIIDTNEDFDFGDYDFEINEAKEFQNWLGNLQK